jgi:hypothetical protein
MKIVFLVLTAPYRPWAKLFDECAARTWAHEDRNLRVFTYQGKGSLHLLSMVWNWIIFRKHFKFLWRRRFKEVPTSNLVAGCKIEVQKWDTWDAMYVKFLAAAKYLIENEEFDYLIRVNTTAFVNIESLEQALASGIDYGGPITKKSFVNGWAIAMSKKFVTGLCNEPIRELDTRRKNDDELIGMAAQRLGYAPKSMPWEEFNLDQKINRLNISDVPFIRIKSKKRRVTRDATTFYQVDKLLKLTE